MVLLMGTFMISNNDNNPSKLSDISMRKAESKKLRQIKIKV
jgi:hypothetical protein